MPRPTTKTELIESANLGFKKMWELIEKIPEGTEWSLEGKEAHWARDKNVRDVLIHLYEWHQLLLNWINTNQKGITTPFLPQPYTWKTYGQMNIEFWKKHQITSYENAQEMLKESHKNVINLVEKFNDKELFEKKHFPWTGTTNLGSYCISATSSHYDWAIKKLKLAMK